MSAFDQIKSQAKKLGKKLLKKLSPLLIKAGIIAAGIIIVVGCIDYIIHIIPNKLSEIKESFIEAKEGIKDFFKIENGTLVVDEELVDEMRKELVSKGIDMSAIGFDDEERNKNLKIFLEAEAATSTPKVLFNSNAGAIEFEKASGGKFDYIDPVTFKNMVNTNNINVQDKYTIEGDNFIYANVIKTEVNGQVTDIKVNTVTENYKTRVSQYAVPFEFFVVLCIQTNQPDFVVDLAEQVKKATIVLSVFDSTTVTTTEEKKSYDIHTEGIRKYSFTILKEEQGNIQEYKKEEWTEGVNRKIDPSVNGVNSGLLSPDMDYSGISLEDLKKLYISRYGEDEWYRNFLNLPLNNQRDVLVAKLQVDQENNVDLISPTVEIEDEHKEEETKTVITSTTSNLQVTRITNWLGQMEIGYSAKKSEPTYTYGEAGKDISYQDGEKKEVTPEKVLSKLAQTHVDFSERELEQELKEQGSNAQIEYRLDKVEADLYTQEINIKKNIKENVVTTEYTVDPQKVNTQEGNRKMEIILELLRRPYKALGMQNNQIAGEMLTSGAEGLFKHLEENDRTRDLANVMRYILYLYSGTDYGVTDLNSLLSNIYGNMNPFGSSDYIVNIDQTNTEETKKLVITDVDILKKAFTGYGSPKKLIEHAQDFLDFQNDEEYRVNAVFAAAVAAVETSGGTNSTATGVRPDYNNWFSIMKDSANGVLMQYPTERDGIEAFYKLIAKNYFPKGFNSVDTIGRGGPYCVPPDGWIQNVIGYMTDMYHAAGIDVSPVIGNAGTLLANAKQCYDYLYNNGYKYSQSGRTIPIVPGESSKTIDCSSYVSWVLYEYGYTELKGPQLTANMNSLGAFMKRKGFKQIASEAELQPGDIVIIDASKGWIRPDGSHIQIYAGQVGGVQSWYNCGVSPTQPGPTVWNLNSSSTPMKFIMAFRVP